MVATAVLERAQRKTETIGEIYTQQFFEFYFYKNTYANVLLLVFSFITTGIKKYHIRVVGYELDANRTKDKHIKPGSVKRFIIKSNFNASNC